MSILGNYSSNSVALAQARMGGAAPAPATGLATGLATPPATPAPAPGERGGPAPAVGGVDEGLTALDKFRKSGDDKGNLQTTQEVQPIQFKPEHFAEISKQVAGKLQINEADQEAALRGDAEALNRMLAGMMQDVVQQTMFASAVTSQNLQAQALEQASKSWEGKQKQSEAQREANSAALAIAPQLDNEVGAELLATRLAALRAEYPTAPAKLLGETAAKQVIALSAPQATPSSSTEPDWDEHASAF